MCTDVHAHYISSKVVEETSRKPEFFGVRFNFDPNGGACAEFAYGLRIRPLFPAMQDLDRRLSLMDQRQIKHQLIAPWPDLFGYGLDGERGARWSRLLNETAAADISERGHRFSGAATVPLQDIDRAIKELRHALHKLGFRSVMIASSIFQLQSDERYLDRFWAAVQAEGIPVIIHPLDAPGADTLGRYFLNTLVGYPFGTTVAAGHLIFGGVFDRFPELKIVLVHGGGFFPYQVGRMQHGYEISPDARLVARKAPLEYLKNLYFDTLLFYPPALRFLLDLAGSDHVLMGTDDPFPIGDPDPLATLENAELDPQVLRQITTDNAVRLFRLSVD